MPTYPSPRSFRSLCHPCVPSLQPCVSWQGRLYQTAMYSCYTSTTLYRQPRTQFREPWGLCDLSLFTSPLIALPDFSVPCLPWLSLPPVLLQASAILTRPYVRICSGFRGCGNHELSLSSEPASSRMPHGDLKPTQTWDV